MDISKGIFLFLSVFSIFGGMSLIFVKIDPNEVQKLAKVFPGASLFIYPWFKFLLSFGCFLIAILSLLEFMFGN